MTSPLLPKPAANLPSGITRADFFMGKYCLSADAVTGDQRLIDVLRDSTRQYMSLRRVRVISLEGVEPIVEYSDALLKKAEVEWVAVRDESARAAARLYGYVRKTAVRVALVLPMCRIEGNAHIESKATDPVVFFLRGLEQSKERFLPVTEATITPSPDGADAVLQLAIVNRDNVRLYSVLTA
jgi:hypothetical protein